MKVKAIKEVYYDNKRRKEGAVFELREIKGLMSTKDGKQVSHVFTVEEQFSALSMECLEPSAKVGDAQRVAKVRTPKTLKEAAKTDMTVISDLEVI